LLASGPFGLLESRVDLVFIFLFPLEITLETSNSIFNFSGVNSSLVES